MTTVKAHSEWLEMRKNIRRAVHSLEVCWKCQNVSECQKYVLGNTVLVWLCNGCMKEMEKPMPQRPKSTPRAVAPKVSGSWETFR